MTKQRAIKEAIKMAKIWGNECVVIKVKRRLLWYFPETWFTFFMYENVASEFIKNYEFNGRVYYTTN